MDLFVTRVTSRACARALARLATDDTLAQQMSANALDWVQGFDESRRAVEYLDVYREAIAN